MLGKYSKKSVGFVNELLNKKVQFTVYEAKYLNAIYL